jgi:hypothetical protein
MGQSKKEGSVQEEREDKERKEKIKVISCAAKP